MEDRQREAPASLELADARKVLRSYWLPRLSEELDRRRQEGRYPFEGRWYTDTEVHRFKEELRRQQPRALLRLALAFGAGLTLFAVLALLGCLIVFL